MKIRWAAAAGLTLAAFLAASCGSQSGSGGTAAGSAAAISAEAGSSEEAAPGVSAEAVSSEAVQADSSAEAAENVLQAETAAASDTGADSVTDADQKTQETTEAGAADDPAGAAGDVHPYAWLGQEDMPSCPYLDLLSTGHYIRTYDYYTMGYFVEETEAVDGVNSVIINENNRSYAVDGHILSVSDNSKVYMEYDMSSAIEEARANLKAAIQEGTNIFGRTFTLKGSGPVPLYSDAGDTAEYEYYEYSYPEAEAAGSEMTERYYMKDGDVFAIWQKTKTGQSEVEGTKVIKSISGEIPEGTFTLPDLEGYTPAG